MNSNQFDGEIYHSQNMKNIDFKNKNIVIVGNAISGPDLCEYACAQQANKVYNIYRTPRHFFPLIK